MKGSIEIDAEKPGEVRRNCRISLSAGFILISPLRISAQRKRILNFGQIGISIARKRWASPESERALPRPNAEFIGWFDRNFVRD
jgi:hypothetical protein